MKTIYDMERYARERLRGLYTEDEIRSLCRLIFTRMFLFTNIRILLYKHEEVEKIYTDVFEGVIGDLLEGKPIDYIIGYTEFAGLTVYLNPDTLIPRPETEELVAWVVDEAPETGVRVLDVGTGSGCIALALASMIEGARVEGIDVAERAVEEASQNASLNELEVAFEVRDIFRHEEYEWPSYDIIVSNPPYVRESERAAMEPRVLDYEPARALFVPDEDPLVFYRAIGEFGMRHLVPGGSLYFEINEALGLENIELLKSLGYTDLVLRHDLFDKPRMVRGCKPLEDEG